MNSPALTPERRFGDHYRRIVWTRLLKEPYDAELRELVDSLRFIHSPDVETVGQARDVYYVLINVQFTDNLTEASKPKLSEVVLHDWAHRVAAYRREVRK